MLVTSMRTPTRVFEMSQPLGPVLEAEADKAGGIWIFFAAAGLLGWLAALPLSRRLARMASSAWAPGGGRLLRRLRRGIIEGELELHYQPKLNLATGELDGVEALVRWRRDGVLVPPGEFLPAIEGSTLIRRLTLFVLDAGLAQAREWDDEGRPVRVAVNLAAANLHDRRIVGDVSDALARHGVDPSRLTLEVTETSVFEDEEDAGAVLEQLAALGVCLSVDDFGTGHSSLARVTRHPFTEVKIDRSFVMELTREHRPIVATIIRLARTLDLRVVAEGVEDEATLNALRGLGCDVAQGFLLARPVPARDLDDAVAHLPRLATSAEGVRALLEEIRDVLGLDAAFVAEFVEADEVFVVAAGDSEAFKTQEGRRQPLHESYCSRVVSGVFPNLITDARADPLTRDLPPTERIGAYIGVPIRRTDGRLYGTLCGLGHGPRPDLTDVQVATLEAFGDRIAPLLDSAHLALAARQP
jgi:EAL domain-containing protein (putative c-di-GMP-specific phosphodiesterase class I)